MDNDPTPDSAPVVLVAEDEAFLRLLAAEGLEDAGYRTITAKDANEALEILKNNPDVRVLFTDIQMPGPLNGVELALRVHEKWPHVLLLITSGNVRLEKDDIPDHGHFVQKPYRLGQVVEEIKSLAKEADEREAERGPQPA